MRKRIALLPLALCSILFGFSQEAIYLTNPSFEDAPIHSNPPEGWADCGFIGESPPDVQPSGDFGVYREAEFGKTYLGMVVRDNDTWERVSQRLSRPLEQGKCYEFSLALAKSRYYISASQTTEMETNYTTPVRILIYGGSGECDRAQLLDDTDPVAHHEWRQYKFKLEPNKNYSWIVIEAYYETPVLFPYNGNILVDNASPITLIPCDKDVPDEPEAIEEPPVEPIIADNPTPRPSNPQSNQTSPPQATNPVPTPQPSPPQPTVKEDKTIAGVKRSDMKKGLEIQLENVFFEADSSRIRRESTPALEEVYDFLKTYNDMVIEIGGHTNSYPPDAYCDRLSEARAKAVADYLAAKGIARTRLQYKGYGKRKPIATNETKAGRKKNQRVEIKILEMGGGG